MHAGIYYSFIIDDLLLYPFSNVCFDGLKANPKKSVKLTFHILCPRAYWEWDSTSAMYIRFGHQKLGSWNDCGSFQEVRYVCITL